MYKITNKALNRISVVEFKNAPKFPVQVVLENVRSAYNVGAVFRNCDAFRVEKIWLCGITPSPPHREILKTALGSTESVAWESEKNILTALNSCRKNNYKIVALEHTVMSRNLQAFSYSALMPAVFVFGNEVNGISEEVLRAADYHIEIPQLGTKHSFNIAVSVGIVLWHFFYTGEQKKEAVL